MRLHHRLLIAAAAALVLAGCGASTPTPAPASAAPSVAAASPTESPSPIASASASAAAVTAKDVLAQLADPGLAFTSDVTGTVKVGTLSIPVTGKLDVGSGANHSILTIALPSKPQTTETIAVGGITYNRTSPDAPWFEAPKSTAGEGLGQALATIGNVTDKGITTRDGKPVHHFGTVPGALPASALGLDKPGISGFSGTFDLYADDAGKLVAMGLGADWNQAAATGVPVPASMTLDFALTDAKPTIAAPDQVWLRFTSSRWPYSIGYPKTMQIAEGKKPTAPDVFATSSDEFYGVILEKQPNGVKLTDYVKAYVDSTYKQYKVKPEQQFDLAIDGRPGKGLVYHIKLQGKDRYNLVAMTLDGHDGYTIFLVTNPGQENDAGNSFDQVLNTVKLGG